MSNKGNALFSLSVLIIGAIFLWLCNRVDFLHGVVVMCGLAFVLPAVISLVSVFRSHRDSGGRSPVARGIQFICGVGGLGLGICILLMPATFRSLLVYLFAALLVAGGAYQVGFIARKSRTAGYPGWFLVAPILVLVAGVAMVCFESLRHMEHEQLLVIATGCAFVLYGLNGLLLTIIHVRGHRVKAEPVSSAELPVGDVPPSSPAVGVEADRLDAETAADVKGN